MTVHASIEELFADPEHKAAIDRLTRIVVQIAIEACQRQDAERAAAEEAKAS